MKRDVRFDQNVFYYPFNRDLHYYKYQHLCNQNCAKNRVFVFMNLHVFCQNKGLNFISCAMVF